jgi:hypothetical protein
MVMTCDAPVAVRASVKLAEPLAPRIVPLATGVVVIAVTLF